jgi:hypothetical protein
VFSSNAIDGAPTNGRGAPSILDVCVHAAVVSGRSFVGRSFGRIAGEDSVGAGSGRSIQSPGCPVTRRHCAQVGSRRYIETNSRYAPNAFALQNDDSRRRRRRFDRRYFGCGDDVPCRADAVKSRHQPLTGGGDDTGLADTVDREAPFSTRDALHRAVVVARMSFIQTRIADRTRRVSTAAGARADVTRFRSKDCYPTG